MIFAIRKPDGQVLSEAKLTMREAQERIAELEPDIVEQGKWQIHPLDSQEDCERARIKMVWKLKLEKFEGETLVETIEREGVN